MKVYFVFRWLADSCEHVGVFSSLKTAEKYIEESSSEDLWPPNWDIEEFELDEVPK